MEGKRPPRKLLVASLGVATINYVLAGVQGGCTVANMPAPAPTAGSSNAGASGGDSTTAGASNAGAGGKGGTGGTPPTVANLPAPPPMLSGGRGSSD